MMPGGHRVSEPSLTPDRRRYKSRNFYPDKRIQGNGRYSSWHGPKRVQALTVLTALPSWRTNDVAALEEATQMRRLPDTDIRLD